MGGFHYYSKLTKYSHAISPLTLQPCEYKAIGCKEMVPKGKMKQHLQEGVQHHLDLAIKRILHNEAKK